MSTLITHREELHRLLKPAVLFTTDEKLSHTAALRCVVIEGRGKHALAFATDRFTATAVRCNATQADGDFLAALDRDDVKQLLSMFKATRAEGREIVELTVEGTSLRVKSGPVEAAFALFEVDAFPMSTLRRLISTALGDTREATGLGFNPALLGRLKDVAAAYGKGTDLLKIRFGSNDRKPATVTIGDDFIALIMPRSNGGLTFDEMEAWSSELSGAPVLKDAS